MLDLILETLDDTVSTMITVFLMLFITGIMTEMNVFQRVSFIAKPLVSISRLPEASASSLVISIGSALAANTMIARLKEEGHLTERQAFLSAIMNSVPVYFRELFTYQLAFVIPVLGIFVGGVYALVAITTGLVKLILVMILGRACLSDNLAQSSGSIEYHSDNNIIAASIKSLRGQSRIFFRIAALYFIMTFLVLYSSQRGILQSLDVHPIANLFMVPPDTVIPLTIYVASPKAGITLLGPMIQNGGISESKALIVLMLGSLFMLPVYSIRSLMPNYTSVFGMRLGLSLVAVSTGISVLVRLLVLIALLMATG
ncbi:MAG: hypothetical protein A4E48_01417 [Methanosaeta sp. PtaU1.Bin060]|jgi:hypothetical protein|nr:MAG: hypothetical protein A4E48_01417 [Methanosaeta sp. PtaU1.Bin060]